MKGRLIRPAVVALVAVGTLLVAGGIAYATIPDGNGVIHGCYKTNSGTLRVIDSDQAQTCSNSETPLNWGQTGPQGAQGPQGKQGPQGPQGPTGPSDVWSVDGYDAGLKNVGPFDTWVVIATTPTLPTGSYVVDSEVEIHDVNSLTTDYACDLVDSEANIYQDTRETGPSTAMDWVTIPDQAVITLTSPDTISLECFATQAGAEAFNWKLTALAVGTVHS